MFMEFTLDALIALMDQCVRHLDALIALMDQCVRHLRFLKVVTMATETHL